MEEKNPNSVAAKIAVETTEFHQKIRESFSNYAKTYDWPEDVLVSYLMMYAMRQHGDLAERLYRFRKKRKAEILEELEGMGY